MTVLTRVPAVPLTFVPSVPLTFMTSVPFTRMPFTPVPRFFQIIQCLLIRIVPIRQFPFIQIIRRIGIAELGVLFHILFRLIVCA